MNRIRKSFLVRVISLIIVLTFVSLDISYAYPPEHNAANSTLATPSVLQQTPINEQIGNSVLFKSALVALVCDVGEYSFGDTKKEGTEPLPSKYAEDAMRADLSKHLSDAGTEILNIVPVEYIKKTAPEKLKAALNETGFKGTLPDEGVVFILCKKGDRKFLLIVARKDQVSSDSLPGRKWEVSDKYVVKYMPEDYKAPQVVQAQKKPEDLRLIHRGTPDDPLRIVLIMPRSILQKVKPTRFPIGLMSIASCLRDRDFLFKLSNEVPGLKFENERDIPDIDVRIIDLQAEPEGFDLEAELKGIDPDMVGISAVTQLFSAAGNVSKVAAKAVPRAIRVIGGVHISAISERISSEFEDAMNEYGFQIAVIREGEEALSETVLRLASYRDIKDVPGLVIKESETAPLYRTADRRKAKRHLTLDDYPIPAHALDLINRNGYEELVDVRGRNRGIAGSLMTSRGCPYGCIFCASKAVFSRHVEQVSAEKIFEEFKYYYDRGSAGFYIMDDNLCMDPQKIKKLAELIEQSDIDIGFSAFAHANSINEDVARDLKRSGCMVIALGAESGDEELLKKIGKSTSVAKISRATKALQAVGISVKFFLLVGLPGQDWPSIKKTAEIILKNRPNAIDVAVTTPYPGSALYGGDGVKVVDGVSIDQLVHIVEPQLKAKAAVDVLTYTDVMFSEEIARARDLLNTLFRNIDDKNTVDAVMREIEERIREEALNGYPETDITRARKAARESRRLKNTRYGLNDAAKKTQECFGFIRQAIGKAIREMAGPAKPIKLEDVEVTAKASVRLDIASGRGSDLFVVSMEKGGAVLNAAITLNGEKPIRVTVKAIPEYEIRIRSADLNTEQVITDLKSFDVSNTSLANDPLRLYKAALIEAGIIPESLQGDLKDILKELGGGLEIGGKVENIPAGSGLGISSILAATLLKALYEVTGRTPDDRELIMKTVSLEHRLGSYGGWQDIMGGAFGGIKWITAEPGNPVPSYKVLNISPETLAELESRIVLFYTGKQHFAGDILGKIITGYLLREEPCYTAMLEAGAIRDKMLKALEDGDVDSFGALAGDYWKATVKQMGDEASNDIIKRVISETGDLIEGGKASGAGGGGFFFLIAKKGRAKELKERIEKISIATEGRIYKFAFDNEGIKIDKKSNPKALPTPQIPPSDVPKIAVSEDGAISFEDSGRLKNAVTGYFKRVESTPGHRPLNYIYDDSGHVENVEIGDGLFCSLVLNTGRQAYVKKTLSALSAKKQTVQHEPDVMMGHADTPGQDNCFLCNVEDIRIIARPKFRGVDYMLLSIGSPHGKESMILSPVPEEPQHLTGEFMVLFAGCVKALGENYEGSYSEPSASASVYHRHGQIKILRTSILRNEEQDLGLRPLYKIGGIQVSEVTKYPATAYSFQGSNIQELEKVFNAVLSGFHGNNIASNVNMRFSDGKFTIIIYPRIAGREKPQNLCPEYPASYGRFGALEMGGWLIFLSEEGFNFMKELYKKNNPEFRRRVRAALSETSVPRDMASGIINGALAEYAGRSVGAQASNHVAGHEPVSINTAVAPKIIPRIAKLAAIPAIFIAAAYLFGGLYAHLFAYHFWKALFAATIIGGITLSSGSYMEQTFNREPINWSKIWRWGIVGAILTGPVTYGLWFHFLDHLTKSTALFVFLDLFLFAPLVYIPAEFFAKKYFVLRGEPTPGFFDADTVRSHRFLCSLNIIWFTPFLSLGRIFCPDGIVLIDAFAGIIFAGPSVFLLESWNKSANISWTSVIAYLLKFWKRLAGRGQAETKETVEQIAPVQAETLKNMKLGLTKALDFLTKNDSLPAEPDILMIFTCENTRIPKEAAILYKKLSEEGRKPKAVLFSGGTAGSGFKDLKKAAGLPGECEAEIYEALFKKELKALKMPDDEISKIRVLIEPLAANTGENVKFSKKLLEESGLSFRNIILMTYLHVRAGATFEKEFGYKCACSSYTPDISEMTEEKLKALSYYVVDEIRKVGAYGPSFAGDRAYMAEVAIPPQVINAVKALKDLLINDIIVSAVREPGNAQEVSVEELFALVKSKVAASIESWTSALNEPSKEANLSEDAILQAIKYEKIRQGFIKITNYPNSEELAKIDKGYEPAENNMRRPEKTDIFATAFEVPQGELSRRLEKLADDIIEILPEGTVYHKVDPSTYHISVTPIQDLPFDDIKNKLTGEERESAEKVVARIAAEQLPYKVRFLGLRFGTDGGIIAIFEDEGLKTKLLREKIIVECNKVCNDKVSLARKKPLVSITLARVFSKIAGEDLSRLKAKAEELKDLSSLGMSLDLNEIGFYHETRWMHSEFDYIKEYRLGAAVMEPDSGGMHATQLFDLVESSLSNERAKYIESGNRLAGGLDKDMATAEIRQRVQRAIGAIKKLDQKDVSPEVLANIELLKKNLNQFEADGAVGSLIVLARKAKREDQKLIIGLETDWIPGMKIRGSLQRKAIAMLMKEICSIGRALQSMGLDNVEIVRGSGSQLADSLIKAAKDSRTDMRNIVVMASKGTIEESVEFKVFRDADEKDRPFLTGIDPVELTKLYEQYGESVSKQLHIKLVALLYMTLEAAAGKEPPKAPWIQYDSVMRILILVPSAEPIDYKVLESNYAAEKAALSAA